jgi:hypothetical protein
MNGTPWEAVDALEMLMAEWQVENNHLGKRHIHD